MVMRLRSQGLAAPVAQDLERDLLLAAVRLTDDIVVDLVARYKKLDLITFRRNESLTPVRNKLLRQMGAIAEGSTRSTRRPPTPSPLPDMSVSTPLPAPPADADAVPSPVATPPVTDLFVGTSLVHDSCPPHALDPPVCGLTPCDTQCAGCESLQSENARLQQAEQQASERIAMLEAENQHLRSLSQRSETSEQSPSGQPSAGAESAAASELNAEAAVAGPPVSSVPRPPLPPARVAKTLQVVVHGLRCEGSASRRLLVSVFSTFCRDQLRVQAPLSMSAVKVFNTQHGTVAGVVALQTLDGLEALFRAKRQHLRADSAVSIEPNRTRAERLACAIARRARRASPSQQRTGAAGVRIDAAGPSSRMTSEPHPPSHRVLTRSTLRADAPEFVPAAARLQRSTSLPSTVAPHAHSLHQE